MWHRLLVLACVAAVALAPLTSAAIANSDPSGAHIMPAAATGELDGIWVAAVAIAALAASRPIGGRGR